MKGPVYFALVSNSAAWKKKIADVGCSPHLHKNAGLKKIAQTKGAAKMTCSSLSLLAVCCMFFFCRMDCAGSRGPLKTTETMSGGQVFLIIKILFMWGFQALTPPVIPAVLCYLCVVLPPPEGRIKSLELITVSVTCTDMLFPDVQTCWANTIRSSEITLTCQSSRS